MFILDEEGEHVQRYLSLLHSAQIISPVTEIYQEFIVAAKHAVLPVFLLIALDYALFYKWFSDEDNQVQFLDFLPG